MSIVIAPNGADPQTLPTGRLLCSPWAVREDIPARYTGLVEEELDRALLLASEILFQLSGRRYRGAGCDDVAIVDRPPRLDPRDRSLNAWWASYPLADVILDQGRLYNAPCGASTVVRLPTYPVTEIIGVMEGVVALDASVYDLRRGYELHRVDGGFWRPGTTIHYRHGQTPPQTAITAAAVLAAELALTDRERSRLPRRVTSIVRNGVTIGLIDPMKFLDNGRTGVYEVDLFLAAVNPKGARRRSVVWSPDLPQVARRTTAAADPPSYFTLVLRAGRPYTVDFRWTEDDGTTPRPLAGWLPELDVYDTDGNVTETRRPGEGLQIEPAGLTGLIRATWTDTETVDLASGSYQLRLVQGSNRPVLVEGAIFVEQS